MNSKSSNQSQLQQQKKQNPAMSNAGLLKGSSQIKKRGIA